MDKKIQIHQFDPVIYPIKLWIIKKPNLIEVKDKFLVHNNNELNIQNNKNAYASTYNKIVIYKETNKFGILILLHNKLSISNISHEATHAARIIWDWLTENCTEAEADAYLVGWIADCIEQVNTNKFK
jgi:hypothetical protein